MRNSRTVFPLAVTARRPARIVPLLAAVAVGLAGLSSPYSADAQTVVSNDFEDGTTQGRIPRGSAVLTNTTEAANTGTHSLKTTGRTAGADRHARLLELRTGVGGRRGDHAVGRLASPLTPGRTRASLCSSLHSFKEQCR
jgi:hypothetical protein